MCVSVAVSVGVGVCVCVGVGVGVEVGVATKRGEGDKRSGGADGGRQGESGTLGAESESERGGRCAEWGRQRQFT